MAMTIEQIKWTLENYALVNVDTKMIVDTFDYDMVIDILASREKCIDYTKHHEFIRVAELPRDVKILLIKDKEIE